MTSLTKLKVSTILDQTLDEAFPAVDPGTEPFGSLVLLQIKAAATKTKGGLILSDNTIETEADNTKVAKVLACGPLAFHDRATKTPWPEGAWCQPGEFVRIGLYGGDRWRVCYDTVKVKDRDGRVIREQKVYAEFALLEDLVLKGRVKDPLAALAFI
jgi:co-chaperonin GroES (HSP10)